MAFYVSIIFLGSHKQNITKGIVNQLMPTTQPTTVQTPTTPIIHCRKPGLYPVSSNCARHILCSPMLTASSLECPYPKLFHTETLKCEMPGIVKCGTRYEPLDPCEQLFFFIYFLMTKHKTLRLQRKKAAILIRILINQFCN